MDTNQAKKERNGRQKDRKYNIKKKNDTNNKRPGSDTGQSFAILTLKAQWLLYVPPGGTECLAHTVYLRVLQGTRPLSAYTALTVWFL
jgi:hypothetical protein